MADYLQQIRSKGFFGMDKQYLGDLQVVEKEYLKQQPCSSPDLVHLDMHIKGNK